MLKSVPSSEPTIAASQVEHQAAQTWTRTAALGFFVLGVVAAILSLLREILPALSYEFLPWKGMALHRLGHIAGALMIWGVGGNWLVYLHG